MADLPGLVRQVVGDRRVVVALSGGIDSVVLLHAARTAGLDVAATHVDHGLRDDSADDAQFCARYADGLNVPIEVVRIEVSGGNVQGRARRQRYAALFRACARLCADCIATAHHADDAVESAWLQAARGAGPIGRAGPEPVMCWWGLPVQRPLLTVSRVEIAEHARSHGLHWREDPTNLDRSYERNRLRHDVLPDAVDAAQARASMAGLRREAEASRAAVDRLRSAGRAATNFRRFPRDELARAEDDHTARLLLEEARQLHGALSGALVDEIVEAIRDDETESRRFTGSRVVVEVAAGEVTLEATRGQGTRLLDRRRTVEVPVAPGTTTPWFRGTVRMAPSAPAGLRLRGARDGERIVLQEGSVLINDVLARAGRPPSDRWWWPVLFDSDRCVEVVEFASAVEGPSAASFVEFSPDPSASR